MVADPYMVMVVVWVRVMFRLRVRMAVMVGSAVMSGLFKPVNLAQGFDSGGMQACQNASSLVANGAVFELDRVNLPESIEPRSNLAPWVQPHRYHHNEWQGSFYKDMPPMEYWEVLCNTKVPFNA